MAAAGEVIYDAAEAAAMCSWYQGVLRLRDWRVEVVISSKRDMPAKVQAKIDWNLLRKTATIRLMRPWDYRRSGFKGAQDMELDIVHELCHLHLAPLGVDPDSAEDTAQEQAIEAISEACVALVRAKRAS